MINKVFISGHLHSGPRNTILTEDQTPVTFFELNYRVDGVRIDSSVKKAIVSCVCYGNKANLIYDQLISYKNTFEGGDYEGDPPYLLVEGSIQSRKIKLDENKKMRIQQVNISKLIFLSEDKEI